MTRTQPGRQIVFRRRVQVSAGGFDDPVSPNDECAVDGAEFLDGLAQGRVHDISLLFRVSMKGIDDELA